MLCIAQKMLKESPEVFNNMTIGFLLFAPGVMALWTVFLIYEGCCCGNVNQPFSKYMKGWFCNKVVCRGLNACGCCLTEEERAQRRAARAQAQPQVQPKYGATGVPKTTPESASYTMMRD